MEVEVIWDRRCGDRCCRAESAEVNREDVVFQVEFIVSA